MKSMGEGFVAIITGRNPGGRRHDISQRSGCRGLLVVLLVLVRPGVVLPGGWTSNLWWRERWHTYGLFLARVGDFQMNKKYSPGLLCYEREVLGGEREKCSQSLAIVYVYPSQNSINARKELGIFLNWHWLFHYISSLHHWNWITWFLASYVLDKPVSFQSDTDLFVHHQTIHRCLYSPKSPFCFALCCLLTFPLWPFSNYWRHCTASCLWCDSSHWELFIYLFINMSF